MCPNQKRLWRVVTYVRIWDWKMKGLPLAQKIYENGLMLVIIAVLSPILAFWNWFQNVPSLLEDGASADDCNFPFDSLGDFFFISLSFGIFKTNEQGFEWALALLLIGILLFTVRDSVGLTFVFLNPDSHFLSWQRAIFWHLSSFSFLCKEWC